MTPRVKMVLYPSVWQDRNRDLRTSLNCSFNLELYHFSIRTCWCSNVYNVFSKLPLAVTSEEFGN